MAKPMQSKYETHIEPRLNEIAQWAMDGMTEKDMARNLGITYSTFRLHKGKQSALSAALMAAVPTIVKEMEGNAKRIASGYDTTEVTREYGFDRDGNRILIKETERVRHIPASAQMAEFILCNKAPDEWRRKQEIDTKVSINKQDIKALDLRTLSDEELAELADREASDV